MSGYYDIQPLSSCPGPKFLVGQQLGREQVTDDMRTQAAMEMYLIEQEIIVLSQLQVINVQRLRDFDGLAVRSDSSGIRAVRSAECEAIIVEHKLVRKMGLPAFEGGFPIGSPVFKTWLHLKMLIDVDTPLVDLDRPTHPSDLRVVCRSVERILYPRIDRLIDTHDVNKYASHNEARKLTQNHVDGLVSYLLFQHTKLAALREDCDDMILV